MSVPVSVDFAGTLRTIRFLLVTGVNFVLISFSTLQELGAKIDLQTNIVEFHMQQVPLIAHVTTAQASVQEDLDLHLPRPTQKNIAPIREYLERCPDLMTFPKGGAKGLRPLALILNGEPVRQAARPLSEAMQKLANETVDSLLALDLIRPAPHCKWISPIHFEHVCGDRFLPNATYG